MEDYPENLIEFENRFATEAACRIYLVHRGLVGKKTAANDFALGKFCKIL